jgi:hypothetical protein
MTPIGDVYMCKQEESCRSKRKYNFYLSTKMDKYDFKVYNPQNCET